MKNGEFLTLGIESSCDETSVAIVAQGRRVLSNIISSQIEIHTAYGGVVPEIASRHHLNNINTVIDQALAEAEVKLDDIDLIGVTKGPGLIGALLVGMAAAKSLSFAKDIPIVGVHHLKGHIAANYIAAPELEPPFTAVVVSGGNTDIIDVKDYNDMDLLGVTRDDAAGEAMDKVARVLDLGYPGGPKIDVLAKQGNPHAVEFKRVFLEKGSYDFSFSGLKTGVLNYVNGLRQQGKEINSADIAASFQLAVVEVIVAKAVGAAREYGRRKLALAGGVAANSLLRKMMEEACIDAGIEFYRPEPVLCTDNAAMIACAAYYRYKDGYVDDLSLDAYPVLDF
ncbi:MAG: tRNA (adenosine(37)-N6)-threonylcarbamoyltransferase complex transferase subunit TsaD [Firmicutes bacterium]|nr:tRNA (adenosine(37)-N6)-threonylcarbamoyltransferase complex transferase subunit TsaD [Bacillota bacterium]